MLLFGIQSDFAAQHIALVKAFGARHVAANAFWIVDINCLMWDDARVDAFVNRNWENNRDKRSYEMHG